MWPGQNGALGGLECALQCAQRKDDFARKETLAPSPQTPRQVRCMCKGGGSPSHSEGMGNDGVRRSPPQPTLPAHRLTAGSSPGAGWVEPGSLKCAQRDRMLTGRGQGAHSGCHEALVPPGDLGDTSRPCVGTGCPICLLTPGPDQDSHLFEGKVNATGVLPNPTPPAPRRGEQILQDPCQFTRKADDLRQATQETGCVWGWSQRFSCWEKQPPTMP